MLVTAVITGEYIEEAQPKYAGYRCGEYIEKAQSKYAGYRCDHWWVHRRGSAKICWLPLWSLVNI